MPGAKTLPSSRTARILGIGLVATALVGGGIERRDPSAASVGGSAPAIIVATPVPPVVVDPAVAEAVASGKILRVNVGLRGARPLPPGASLADEQAFTKQIAKTHRSLRSTLT